MLKYKNDVEGIKLLRGAAFEKIKKRKETQTGMEVKALILSTPLISR